MRDGGGPVAGCKRCALKRLYRRCFGIWPRAVIQSRCAPNETDMHVWRAGLGSIVR
jgi:hypothetical protein